MDDDAGFVVGYRGGPVRISHGGGSRDGAIGDSFSLLFFFFFFFLVF